VEEVKEKVETAKLSTTSKVAQRKRRGKKGEDVDMSGPALAK
jgi:hypothetical protein